MLLSSMIGGLRISIRKEGSMVQRKDAGFGSICKRTTRASFIHCKTRAGKPSASTSWSKNKNAQLLTHSRAFSLQINCIELGNLLAAATAACFAGAKPRAVCGDDTGASAGARRRHRGA